MGIRTRKRGKTYSYIFEAGKGENGKRKVIEKGGFPTKDAAYDAGVEAYNDWKHGNIGITSEKISLNEYIRHWLDNVASTNIRQSSLERYNLYHRLYIEPYFHGVSLQEATPAIIDKWIRKLLQKGLSRNTISSAKNVLSHSLEYAVYPAELIAKNPAHYIKIPRSAPTDLIERKIISTERFNELIEKRPAGDPLHIPLVLLYHTGLRLGEVIGLSWDNIDLENRKILVDKQIVKSRERKYFFISPTKTKTSVREISFGETLLTELKRWKAMQERNESEYGDAYVKNYIGEGGRIISASISEAPEQCRIFNAVCTKENGTLLSRSTLSAFLLSNNLNAHSFRHSHITMLIENGASPKSVAARVGHSKVDITQNIYTHITEKMQTETADIFEKITQTNTNCRQNADN